MKTSVRLNMKHWRLIFLFLAIFPRLLLGAEPTPQTVNEKEKLSIALNAEFETLHPTINSMMSSIYILDATVRPLVALDPKGKIIPLLIKEVPSIQNKKVTFFKRANVLGLRADIEILPGAKWGDGVPVTCDDVRTAWEIGTDETVPTPNRQEFLNIDDIKIDPANSKKCAILFKEAKWNFYLNFPKPVPTHLEKKIFLEHKGKAQGYERNSLYVKEVTNAGLYNGPFKVTELKPGSHIILSANPQFHGKSPAFKTLIFKFILNTATMEANLRSGGVDMTSSSGLSFDQALAFEKKTKALMLPFDVIIVPGTIYSHIDFNLDNPILKDLRVRQALAHAFNREEVSKAFFENRQKAALHFSTELDSWYTEDPKEIKIYDFSKDKAKKLLDEAGWKLGEDGYRRKGDQKLTLTLSGVADNKLNDSIQGYLQASWKQIGVELMLKNSPARVFLGEQVRHRKFEMANYSFVSSPDGSQAQILSSIAIPSEKNGWSGSNRTGWKNTKVDEWLKQLDVEFKPEARVKLMRKVMKAYTEELPALPLYYRSNNSVVPKGLKNYRPSGHIYTEYLEVENWSF